MCVKSPAPPAPELVFLYSPITPIKKLPVCIILTVLDVCKCNLSNLSHDLPVVSWFPRNRKFSNMSKDMAPGAATMLFQTSAEVFEATWIQGHGQILWREFFRLPDQIWAG